MGRPDPSEREVLALFEQTCLADVRARDRLDVTIDSILEARSEPWQRTRNGNLRQYANNNIDANLQYTVSQLLVGENPNGLNLVRVKCTVGASVDDPPEILRGLPRLFGNDLNLQVVESANSTVLEEVRKFDGTDIRVTYVPEGDTVVSRSQEDLTEANDFRFTSISVRWLRAPEEGDKL